MKPVALVDADGVFMDYRLSLVREIARVIDKPMNDEFVLRFHQSVAHLTDGELLSQLAPPGVNLHRLMNSSETHSYAATAVPYPDALDAFKLLKAHQFRVCVVTARTERMRAMTELSFVRHGLSQFIDELFLRQSEQAHPPRFKADMAIRLSATHAFEDTMDNLRAIRAMISTHGRAYLINRPWNARHPEDELYPTSAVPIERMDSFYLAAMDAVATLEK